MGDRFVGAAGQVLRDVNAALSDNVRALSASAATATARVDELVGRARFARRRDAERPPIARRVTSCAICASRSSLATPPTTTPSW